MDIARKKSLIIYVLIFASVFLFGKNVLFNNYLSKIESLKMQAEEGKKKNDIFGVIAILDKKLQGYQNRSFSSQGITLLVDRISELAEQNDVTIETLNPLQTKDKKEHVEIPLRIPLRCQYHQLGKFLSFIEGNQEVIWVEELRMQKPPAADYSEAKIPKIDLTVNGLYLKK